MVDEKKHDSGLLKEHRSFKEKVAARQARKKAAQAKKLRTVWFGLGTFGLVGWSVAIPTVIGASIGVWLDSNYPSEHLSWTLTLLTVGVVLGCWNAWMWVDKESKND